MDHRYINLSSFDWESFDGVPNLRVCAQYKKPQKVSDFKADFELAQVCGPTPQKAARIYQFSTDHRQHAQMEYFWIETLRYIALSGSCAAIYKQKYLRALAHRVIGEPNEALEGVLPLRWRRLLAGSRTYNASIERALCVYMVGENMTGNAALDALSAEIDALNAEIIAAKDEAAAERAKVPQVAIYDEQNGVYWPGGKPEGV